MFLPLSIDSASFDRFQMGEVAWCGGFNCCMSGRLSFTYSFTLLTFCRQQVKLQRNMMPKLRLSAKQMASEFMAAKALESRTFLHSGRQCWIMLVRKAQGFGLAAPSILNF